MPIYEGELTWTIEPSEKGWWVCQRGTYSRSSVLAGQSFRQLVQFFNSPEEAQEAYPKAIIDRDGTKPEPVEVSRLAPDWFDPLDAGEVWSEDEY